MKAYKKIVSIICVIALMITSTIGFVPTTILAEDTVTDITVSQAIGNYGTVESYQYRYSYLYGATSEYKYMIIKYTGDIEPLRIECSVKEGYTKDENLYWIDQSKTNTLKLVGSNPILSSGTEAIVVIDLEATGINLDAWQGMHMHYGPGTLNIIDVKLSATQPEGLWSDIVLTDAISTYGEDDSAAYAYKDAYFTATSDYKYLFISYEGSISRCRLGFYNSEGKIGTELWVDSSQSSSDLVLVDENPIFESETGATVIVDLEASGIAAEELVRIRVQSNGKALKITDCRLTTKLTIDEEEETTTVEPTTEDILLSSAIGTYGTDNSSGWKCKDAYLDAVPSAEHKYVVIKYVGNITRCRLGFYNASGQVGTEMWVDPGQSSSDLTLVGHNPVFKSQTGAMVVIDIAASGFNPAELTRIRVHNDNRILEITECVLTRTLPEMPVTDIVAVEAIYDFGNVEEGSETVTHNASLEGATYDYKYMFITYVGDISKLRIQGVKDSQVVGDAYWMDQSETTHFALVGDSPILESETAATVVIDLENSDIDLSQWDSIDMYYGPGTLEIGNVRLSKSSEVKDGDSFRYFKDKEPVTDYSYSFAVVGDTQLLSYYDKTKGTNDLGKIYDWILDNKVTKNIKYVFGLGDIVETPVEDEWKHASQEISKLDGNIPYSLIRGNHDISGVFFNKGDTTDYFTQYLGTDAYKQQFSNGGFYEEDNIFNVWHTFTVGEINYLMLALDYGPSDEVLAWADEIVEAHPNHNVIVTTHAYLDDDGSKLLESPTGFGGYNNGDQIWTKFVSKHKNIVLVMGGHVAEEKVVMSQEKGINGNTVTSILVNPQGVDKKEGATGMVAMLYFSEDGKNVQLEYYSTVRDRYFLEENQFGFELAVVEPSEEPSTEEPSSDVTTPEETSSEEPSSEQTSDETTAAPTIEESTVVEPTTTKAKVNPPIRTKVKLATKKKNSKKIKLSIKKVKGAKGYKVQFSKNKKFNNKNIILTKNIKRAKISISSKKFKKAKNLYVRVKAYKMDGKKKVFAKKWSKVKKVKIKK